MTGHSKARPSVVLVHGAWADATSWRRVIRRLLADGVEVIAVQNPTTRLSDDVAATRAAIERASGRVVLVGHSWGGTVITEAGVHPKVAALVYVAAFAPRPGESTGDQVAAHPAPPALVGIAPDSDGRLLMAASSWIADIAQDLPESEARLLAATQTPLGAATFGDAVSQAAWSDRPCWYVLASDDRAVSPSLQHEVADRMMATLSILPTSHMALLSAPDAVAGVIRQAIVASG